MSLYPGDIDSRRVDSRACAIVHYQIDSATWDYKVPTGHDVGTDCELELSTGEEWSGKKIEVQIKGTEHIENYLVNDGTVVSFKLQKTAIRYALNKAVPFFLFVVDVSSETVYFAEMHQYFINNADLFRQLDSETKSMQIHIPVSASLEGRSQELVAATDYVYIGGPNSSLRAVATADENERG